MLSLPQLKKIQSTDPYLHEALKKMVGAINALAQRTGLDPTGAVATPAAPAQLLVTAANGMFDIALVDTSKPHPGINYFVEYDTTPNFNASVVLDLGASRNLKIFLGNITVYFRGYSQYQNSLQSPKVNFGNPPTAVTGGGAAPPAPNPSQGSGSGSGGGFGIHAGCCEAGTPLEFPAGAQVETRIEPCGDWMELETETGRKLRVARHTLVSTFVPAEELAQGDLVEIGTGLFERVKRVKRVRKRSQKIVVQVEPERVYWGNGVRLHNLKVAQE